MRLRARTLRDGDMSTQTSVPHRSGDPGTLASADGFASPNRLAASATFHCLTGCALGEVAGMFIGTALGWGNLPTIALAVGLAYLFGFGLTSLPLLRAGLTLTAVVPIAVAADTVSITIMEVIDNLFVALIPRAMDTGLGDPLLWGSIAGGFVVAFPFAFLANRIMLKRGKGCAAMHQHQA